MHSGYTARKLPVALRGLMRIGGLALSLAAVPCQGQVYAFQLEIGSEQTVTTKKSLTFQATPAPPSPVQWVGGPHYRDHIQNFSLAIDEVGLVSNSAVSSLPWLQDPAPAVPEPLGLLWMAAATLAMLMPVSGKRARQWFRHLRQSTCPSRSLLNNPSGYHTKTSKQHIGLISSSSLTLQCGRGELLRREKLPSSAAEACL
ncbi:MAG TPA: hypothetical protein VNJ09_01075 [Chthonomonadales bacterium]|nr:hypothetical protein [Chthonomonadales bacterium]